MWQDTFNCVLGLCGGIFIALHCVKLHRQKMVRGVSVPAVTFFGLWGLWNLYYYPFLNQWWSFVGGIGTVAANLTWVGMMLYYIRRERRRNRTCYVSVPVHPMCRCINLPVEQKSDATQEKNP